MAHFLVDASLPRSTAELIQSQGHLATDIRDIGLGSAADQAVAEHARANKLCLLTRDQDFGNILDYPPENYFGLVVVRTPEVAPRSLVLRMVERFVQQVEIVERLPGRLAIVEADRVRLRPA